MKTPSRAARVRAGFTLVEILIAVALVSVALVAANMVSARGLGLFRSTSVRSELDTDALRAISRLSTEIAKADASTMLPPAPEDGTSELAYQVVVDVVAGAPVWGAVQSASFEYEDGEIDDGEDNNGNGLVDEGVIVLVRDVGGSDERRVVLCHGVREMLEGEIDNGVDDNGNGLIDEQGFCLQWNDGVLTIRVSVEEVDGDDHHVVRTLETSVRLRNET